MSEIQQNMVKQPDTARRGKKAMKWERGTLLLWGTVVFFTVCYVSLIFNDNVWTDEIFSMNLFAEGFGEIVQETAQDVHPPLYYFLGRIFRLLFGDSLQVQKILTLLPMSLMLALGAWKVRQFWGDRTAFLFQIFLGCLPCTMEYAVQVRMYSWALLCVTVCGLMVWEIMTEEKCSSWILYTAAAAAAAYLHYFALVSVIFIHMMLLVILLLLPKKGKQIRNWLLFSVILIAVYLPWCPYFLKQVISVEGGYWIPEITAETVWGYFTWAFGLEGLWQTTLIYLLIAAAAGAVCLRALFRDGEGLWLKYGFFCMSVPALTTWSGVVLSYMQQPIYRDQYVFPAMGMFCLFAAIGMSKLLGRGLAWLLPENETEREKGIAVFWQKGTRVQTAVMSLLLLFLLFTGAAAYRENFIAEYRSTLTEQTEAFFEENFGENDLVVYNYQAYYFNYKYYFPEEKLAYVREVDLSADFDTIWFLDTEMEWDFVPDQIIPYNLQIEYVGHYGIEYNEFDLYKVTKGAAGV